MKKVGCAKENFGFVSLKELPIGSKDIFQGDNCLLSENFQHSKRRHMLVIPFFAIAERLHSQLQNSPKKLVSLILFVSMSLNFFITWEQLRKSFLFLREWEKSERGEAI